MKAFESHLRAHRGLIGKLCRCGTESGLNSSFRAMFQFEIFNLKWTEDQILETLYNVQIVDGIAK